MEVIIYSVSVLASQNFETSTSESHYSAPVETKHVLRKGIFIFVGTLKLHQTSGTTHMREITIVHPRPRQCLDIVSTFLLPRDRPVYFD
jgi:hypothetical protein